MRPTRLEETIPSKKVTLRTDLIPFKTDANSALLIYSVVDHGTARLISGFPVTRGFVESLIHSPHLGENQPIVTRYNAYVDGVTGQSITGTRRVILSK